MIDFISRFSLPLIIAVSVVIALIVFVFIDYRRNKSIAEYRARSVEREIDRMSGMDLRIKPLGFKVDSSRSDA